MTSEVFVENLKTSSLDGVADRTLELLLNPPGRKPDLTDKPVADWYQKLSSEDQGHARRLAQICADTVLFSVLVALDNCASIADRGEITEVELIVHDKMGSTRINCPTDELLHDTLNRISDGASRNES